MIYDLTCILLFTFAGKSDVVGVTMILSIDTSNETDEALNELIKFYERKAAICEHLSSGVPEECVAGLLTSEEKYRGIAAVIQSEVDGRKTDRALKLIRRSLTMSEVAS